MITHNAKLPDKRRVLPVQYPTNNPCLFVNKGDVVTEFDIQAVIDPGWNSELQETLP